MIAEPGDGWVRLSPRKLLLDPVKTIGQFLVPALIAIVGISSGDSTGRFWPFILPALLIGPIVFGLLPWFTTHYRRTETQFQLRSGWLNKKQSTAPLDRIRSVDLEASLLHRILGLEKVQIGTGVDDERITLDALAREEARALRHSLLTRSVAAEPSADLDPSADLGDSSSVPAATTGGTPGAAPAATVSADPPQVLADIDWSWLRFAPFSLARLVLLASALGVLSQFADELPIWDEDTARSAWDWLTSFAIIVVVTVLFVGGLVGWVVVAVTGYVVQWWDFRLSRERESLHLTSGLFTTRSVTVDETKVRGVEMSEPVLLRVVGGAELSTLATGLESGTQQVLPPCPRDVALSVGSEIVGHDHPLTVPLTSHGPRARRRSWLQHADFAFIVPLGLIWPFWRFDLSWAWWAVIAVVFVLLGVVMGESSYRHLGHALTDDHLVAGSGTTARVRTVLETEGIIGWVIEQSWWQRRIGLAQLIATTAAGAERVVVRDIAIDRAVALADAATPGLLSPFLSETGR